MSNDRLRQASELLAKHSKEPLGAFWEVMMDSGDAELAMAIASSPLCGLQRRAPKRPAFKVGHSYIHEGSTPLILAAHADNLNIAAALVAAGANVLAEDAVKRTAVHIAMSDSGNLELLRLLFDSVVGKNDPTLRKKLFSIMARYGLYNAGRRGFLPIVKFLREVRCVMNAPLGDYGYTVCHGAAEGAHIDILQYLAEQGCCDINLASSDLTTPLHSAVDWESAATVKAILSLFPACNANAVDAKGQTPLISAVNKEYSACAMALLVHGCDISAPSNGDRGAELLALSLCGYMPQVTECLLAHGADVNTVRAIESRESWRSPRLPMLHLAAHSNDPYLLLTLLDNGCDPELVNGNGETLMQVLRRDERDFVPLLMAEISGQY